MYVLVTKKQKTDDPNFKQRRKNDIMGLGIGTLIAGFLVCLTSLVMAFNEEDSKQWSYFALAFIGAPLGSTSLVVFLMLNNERVELAALVNSIVSLMVGFVLMVSINFSFMTLPL